MERSAVQNHDVKEPAHSLFDDIAPSLPETASALHQLQRASRPSPQAIQRLQRTLGNAAVQRLLIQRDDDPYAEDVPNKTGYLGFNPGAKREANVLKGRLKDDVIIALNDPTLEANLQTDEGIGKWIYDTLQIDVLEDVDGFMKMFKFLKEIDPPARDMIAQAMIMFHKAEQGTYRLERLVLSGHSNGIELWGDDTDTQKSGRFILDKDLIALAKLFPGAAAQVEDIMFSACFSATSITLVVGIFPNLKNAWGYMGYSPSAEFDAPEHIAQFEQGTHSDKTLKKEDGRGAATLWTREAANQNHGNGIIRNDITKLDVNELLEQYKNSKTEFDSQFEGKEPISTNMNGLYSLIQYLLLHPGTPKDMIPELESRRNIVLRLRHYAQISSRFKTDYKDFIEPAYKALSRPIPNFGSLSRGKLKEEVDGFKAALEQQPNTTAQAFYDKYLTGLWTLTDQDVIPNNWV